MKFEISKEELLRKLILSAKFSLTRISSNSSLQGTLLKTKEEKLFISSTNLIDYYSSDISINTREIIEVVVDSRKIIEFLNFLSPGKIEVEIDSKKISFKKDKTEGSFNIISPEDFPKKPEIKGEKYLFNKKTVRDNLPLVMFSVAKDDSRPVLTGVNFTNKNNTNYIVSTDGFRLSMYRHDDKIGLFGSISSSVLEEVLNIVGADEELYVVVSEDKKIMFETKECRIYSQLIEGDFPPFEKVIPDGYKTKIIIDREELMRNIKLNAIFARDFSNIVIFDIKKGNLFIKPKIKEEGSMITSQEVDFEGEEQKIAFNYKFIVDFLNNVKTKKIIFEMNSKNAPGIFKMDKKEDYIHIIMPVRTDEDEE